MVALLWCIIAVTFGFGCLSRLPLTLQRFEKVAWAVSIGILGMSWLGILISLLFPYSVSVPLCLGIGGGASFYLLRIPVVLKTEWNGLKKNGVWLLVTILTVLLLGRLFYSHMLEVFPDGWHSIGGSWGDLALHSSLISYFAKQPHFTLNFPLFPDARLTYPFVIDFYSALLLRGGWSMQSALLVPGLALGLALVQLLYFVSMRLFGRVWAAALAVGLFLFNGSPAGMVYAYQEWRATGVSLFTFLQNIPQDYSQHVQVWNLQFSNIPTSLLLPQRSILLGMVTFLILMTLVIELTTRQNKDLRLLFFMAALLFGILPWTHPHSLIAAALILGVFILSYRVVLKKHWKILLKAILLILVLAIPQLIWQKQGVTGGHFTEWYLGGVRLPTENLFVFWMRNYGLEWILLFLLPLSFAYCTISDQAKRFYAGFVLLFIIANLFIFQPNAYDNIKLIVYVHLGFSLYLGFVVVEWAKRQRWSVLISLPVLLSLTLTGGLAIVQQLTQSWPLVSNSDIAFAKAADQVIPPEAIVLTSDQHNHPIPMLAGRHIVLGYRGWLGSYGIDYQTVERDVSLMFVGAENAPSLFAKYNISYVVIGANEFTVWHANWNYYASHYPIVLQQDGWTVYKVD